jgi:iron complex outermembrane receptor protein
MKRGILSSGRYGVLIAPWLLAVPQVVLAQEPATPTADESAYSSSDIVVTAQKRVERLQDVPISVTALGGDALARDRIRQADDLVTQVPNLQLTATVGEGTPSFAIRGVSMSDFSLNQSSPVATYYDEVYKGNFAFLGVALYDLERVEVLRGPQGTLYGKNTTGGAINIISRKPSFDTEGYLSLGYGNYNRFDAEGAINLPLTQTLAARFAFTVARADGWFKNVEPGKPDLNGVREYGLRASLLWEAAPGASFLLRASTSLQNPYNYGIYAQPGPDGIGAGVYEAFDQGTSYFRTGLNRRELASTYTPRRHARTKAISLTSTVDAGRGLTVTSVTSYDRGKLFFAEDNDGSPLRVAELSYTDRASQFAQDLRLTSDWQGPFNFILGGYYSREKVYNKNTLAFFQDLDSTGDGLVNEEDCLETFPLACNLVNQFDQLKHSYALYSDTHYDLGGGVTLRGGLRYSHDDGLQTGLDSIAYGADGTPAFTIIPDTRLSFKRDNVSGKVGLDFKPSRDTLLYANYGRGYRGSSFNAQAFFDPSEVSVAKPETIDAFEVGAKTQLLDRRITLDTSAFYYIYHNQQFVNVDSVTGAATLINIDRSRIYGAEAELRARPTDAFTLRAALGLLHARITRGELSGLDLRGNRLPNAASLTLSGGIDWTLFDTSAGQLSVHPNISYVSSQYFEVINVPRLKQGGYALVGGHIDFSHGPWTASLWAKNLTNTFYTTSRIDLLASVGYDYNHLGTPRTYGASISHRF